MFVVDLEYPVSSERDAQLKRNLPLNFTICFTLGIYLFLFVVYETDTPYAHTLR